MIGVSLWIKYVICEQMGEWVIEYAHDVVYEGDSFLDQKSKKDAIRGIKPVPFNVTR